MSKKEDTKTIEENIGEVTSSPIIIHAQYTKDLSFENPHAPQTFRGQGGNPDMDMNIEIEAQKPEDDKELQEYYYPVPFFF